MVNYSDFWMWTTNTTDASQSGRVGANTGSWAAVTTINLNKLTKSGVDVTNLINQKAQAGDDIYLQDKDDASKWARYHITAAPVDHGSWYSLTVSYMNGGGTPPNNNADTDVTFIDLVA